MEHGITYNSMHRSALLFLNYDLMNEFWEREETICSKVVW